MTQDYCLLVDLENQNPDFLIEPGILGTSKSSESADSRQGGKASLYAVNICSSAINNQRSRLMLYLKIAHTSRRKFSCHLGSCYSQLNPTQRLKFVILTARIRVIGLRNDQFLLLSGQIFISLLIFCKNVTGTSSVRI